MTISSRAERLLGAMSPLVAAHYRIAGDLFDPDDNRGGYVNLGTSENHLLWDLLEPALTGKRPLSPDDTHYHPMSGMAGFRASTAAFLSRSYDVAVDADDLVVVGGATAALDTIAYALCEPGEGIVVPTPYYTGLDDDLGGRAGARVVPAPLSSADGFALRPEVLDEAVRTATAGGVTVRAILLISPANPLGCTYDADTIAAAAEVARRHDLHLVVDEIYAGSVFGDAQFFSAARLPASVLDPARVHVVWGFAKDFGMSGFKVGMLHTRHDGVRAATGHLAAFGPVSTDTQVLLRTMLDDTVWVDRLRAENRRRLAAAHHDVTSRLASYGVTTAPADAGLYVWVDLRPWLSRPTFDAERALWLRLLDDARVSVSPGDVFHCADPGWFRLCYASDRATVREGVDRIGRALHLT